MRVLQATAEMRAHCEAAAERVQEHMSTLAEALTASSRRAADAAHGESPPLRRDEDPSVVATPLAQLLGVVWPFVFRGPSSSVALCIPVRDSLYSGPRILAVRNACLDRPAPLTFADTLRLGGNRVRLSAG